MGRFIIGILNVDDGVVVEHLLLAVTGRTPQVVTETLYALHHEGQTWPTRICVITTLLGYQVLNQDQILCQQLEALCDSLNRPRLSLAEQDIFLIPDGQGRPLQDVRSSEEQDWLGDFVTQVVRRLTANPDLAIHASIAGGRRSMSFYLGHAMTLFGRSQDRLSHVLVDPCFEGLPGFYFPSQPSRFIQSDIGLLDARQARIELSDIAFIRVRHNLPRQLRKEGMPVRMRGLINLMNLSDKPSQLRLHLDRMQCCLYLYQSSLDAEIKVPLGLLEMAFYLLLVQSSIEQRALVRRPRDKEPCLEMARAVIKHLADLLKVSFKDVSGLQTQLDVLIEHNILKGSLHERSLRSLEQGMPRHWFDSRLSQLKRSLSQQLPAALVRILVPRQIWDEQKHCLLDLNEQGESRPIDVRNKNGFYGIALQPEQFIVR